MMLMDKSGLVLEFRLLSCVSSSNCLSTGSRRRKSAKISNRILPRVEDCVSHDIKWASNGKPDFDYLNSRAKRKSQQILD